jgi:aspartate carbamoyltransferase regulatory subunit
MKDDTKKKLKLKVSAIKDGTVIDHYLHRIFLTSLPFSG